MLFSHIFDDSIKNYCKYWLKTLEKFAPWKTKSNYCFLGYKGSIKFDLRKGSWEAPLYSFINFKVNFCVCNVCILLLCTNTHDTIRFYGLQLPPPVSFIFSERPIFNCYKRHQPNYCKSFQSLCQPSYLLLIWWHGKLLNKITNGKLFCSNSYMTNDRCFNSSLDHYRTFSQ